MVVKEEGEKAGTAALHDICIVGRQRGAVGSGGGGGGGGAYIRHATLPPAPRISTADPSLPIIIMAFLFLTALVAHRQGSFRPRHRNCIMSCADIDFSIEMS